MRYQRGSLSRPRKGGPGPEPVVVWAELPGFLQFHVSAASEICYCNLASSAPEAAWATRH